MNGLTELKGSVIKWAEKTYFDVLVETGLALKLQGKVRQPVKDGASSFKPPGGPPALTVLTAKCTFKRARLPGLGSGAGV